jgi:peptidoglycan/LPS O-acetylase OafA/YrhL
MGSMPESTNKRLHFDFLDGVRGLSAFYVLLFHIVVDGKEGLIGETFFLNLFRFGHEAVVIFIVLSGFVLTLPVARSSVPNLSNGIKHFFRRRAKRILPGYYAALFLLPVYFFVVEVSKRLVGETTDWERIRTLFFSGDMFSHLLLVHNISSKWEGGINPVLWSMGTEWWIYFIFALVLIPLWKRFGPVTALAGSILLGMIPTVLLMFGLPTLYGFPHLLMGFGLGMASAILICSQHYRQHNDTWNTALNISALLSFLFFFLIMIYLPSIRLDPKTRFIPDLLVAIVCSGVIIKLSFVEIDGRAKSKILFSIKKILEFKPIKKLGEFSYSLYLTHLAVWSMIGITLHLAPVQAVVNVSVDPMPVRLFVVIPFLVLFAYGFYTIFEKPFLHRHTT